MGANDAAEMLEVAKAECVRLERELADMQALAQVNAMNYSDYAAAIQDAKEARAALAAVQQPNRDSLIASLKVAMLGTTDGDFIEPESDIPAGEMFRLAAEWVEANAAALAVPATGETQWQYGRRFRSTGSIAWLPGDPFPEWWNESQEVWEHVRRQVGPAVEVTP